MLIYITSNIKVCSEHFSSESLFHFQAWINVSKMHFDISESSQAFPFRSRNTIEPWCWLRSANMLFFLKHSLVSLHIFAIKLVLSVAGWLMEEWGNDTVRLYDVQPGTQQYDIWEGSGVVAPGLVVDFSQTHWI